MTRSNAMHPKNAPGDFQVVHGCCVLCGVPWQVAPELFSFDKEGCWVTRQPQDATQVQKMLRVIASGEMDCIRYVGSDPLLDAEVLRHRNVLARATITVNAEDADVAAAVDRWFATHRESLTVASDQLGCGCCVLLWDVEGPAKVISTIPRAWLASSSWACLAVTPAPRS